MIDDRKDGPQFTWHFNPLTTPTASSAMERPSQPLVRPSSPLFADFVETWRHEMAPQWSRLHRQGVDDILRVHLLPAFSGKPVGDITRGDILAFRARLSQATGLGGGPISASRINKVMTILAQALGEAGLRWGFSPPFKGIKRLRAGRPDIHPFTFKEVDALCNEVRKDYRAYLITRFYSGMRTGEVNGLKWHNVDFDHRLIRVREIFSAGMDEPRGKTEYSLRDIPMLPPVVDALRAHRSDTGSEGYVFKTKRGNPIDAHNFANRVWYPLLDRLKLDRRRPYQSRHTTATMLLAAGENPEWIARVMGHANTQMLFTVYSRYVPNLTRRDGSAISDLLMDRASGRTDTSAGGIGA